MDQWDAIIRPGLTVSCLAWWEPADPNNGYPKPRDNSEVWIYGVDDDGNVVSLKMNDKMIKVLGGATEKIAGIVERMMIEKEAEHGVCRETRQD